MSNNILPNLKPWDYELLKASIALDPCGGVFTTEVACRNLGRRCISCDIDEAAVIRGQDRLDGKTPGPVG
jgi:DNA modification methylase